MGSLVGAALLEEAARHGGRPFVARFIRGRETRLGRL